MLATRAKAPAAMRRGRLESGCLVMVDVFGSNRVRPPGRPLGARLKPFAGRQRSEACAGSGAIRFDGQTKLAWAALPLITVRGWMRVRPSSVASTL